MVKLARRGSEDSRRWRGGGDALTAVTFDFTHTLVHSPHLAEIYSEVLRRHGLVARVRDVEREIRTVWREFSCLADPWRDRFTAHPRGARGWWYRFLVRLCESLELDEPSRFAGAELYDRFVQAESWEVFPDVVPTLESLRGRGLRLGLVSNWDHRLPRVLANLGLDRHFEAVEYSSGCGIEKPHPGIFQRCLASLKVLPAHALHVGDSAVEDVEGALAVGMRAMRVDRLDMRSHLGEIIAPMLDGRSGVSDG